MENRSKTKTNQKGKRLKKLKTDSERSKYEGEYSVVNFRDDNTKLFECIPDIWFVDDLKISCYWPPKTGKSFTLRAISGDIPDDTWEVYGCTVISEGHSTYSSGFKVVREKCNQKYNTSSADDEIQAALFRRKHPGLVSQYQTGFDNVFDKHNQTEKYAGEQHNSPTVERSTPNGTSSSNHKNVKDDQSKTKGNELLSKSIRSNVSPCKSSGDNLKLQKKKKEYQQSHSKDLTLSEGISTHRTDTRKSTNDVISHTAKRSRSRSIPSESSSTTKRTKQSQCSNHKERSQTECNSGSTNLPKKSIPHSPFTLIYRSKSRENLAENSNVRNNSASSSNRSKSRTPQRLNISNHGNLYSKSKENLQTNANGRSQTECESGSANLAKKSIPHSPFTQICRSKSREDLAGNSNGRINNASSSNRSRSRTPQRLNTNNHGDLYSKSRYSRKSGSNRSRSRTPQRLDTNNHGDLNSKSRYSRKSGSRSACSTSPNSRRLPHHHSKSKENFPSNSNGRNRSISRTSSSRRLRSPQPSKTRNHRNLNSKSAYRHESKSSNDSRSASSSSRRSISQYTTGFSNTHSRTSSSPRIRTKDIRKSVSSHDSRSRSMSSNGSYSQSSKSPVQNLIMKVEEVKKQLTDITQRLSANDKRFERLEVTINKTFLLLGDLANGRQLQTTERISNDESDAESENEQEFYVPTLPIRHKDKLAIFQRKLKNEGFRKFLIKREKEYCGPIGRQTDTVVMTKYLERFVTLRVRCKLTLKEKGESNVTLFGDYNRVYLFLIDVMKAGYKARNKKIIADEAHQALRIVWGRSKQLLKEKQNKGKMKNNKGKAEPSNKNNNSKRKR